MLGGLVIVSFGIALAALQLLLSRYARVALDQPNERSLHEQPVPRTGGIAVLAGTAVALAFGASPLWLPIALSFALGTISFLDDIHSLPTAARLITHLLAAGILVWYVLSPMNALGLVVLALAIAWITNLYNFMDGSDGIAGGMSVFGFGTYAIAAAMEGETPMLMLCAAISAASAGFLIRNFHPARIFLGDVGSIPLGFLAGGLGVVGWRDDLWPLWFPLLVFAPFIGDATLTLVKRLARREKVWQAHREHYYQHLVRMGAGHRGTAVVAYLLMIFCGAASLYARTQAVETQLAVFAGACIVLIAVAAGIDVLWARHNRTVQRLS